MELFQCILRNCEAEKYSKNFTNHLIEFDDVKLLSDEDLRLIGIEDENIRAKLLQKFAQLLMPLESRIPLIIDDNYASVVLLLISKHLLYHETNLMCALKQRNYILSDIEMGPTIRAAKKALSSLKHKLAEFESSAVLRQKKKRSSKKKIIAISVLAPISVLFSFTIYKVLMASTQS